jgi:hypothetical protein
LHRIYKGGLEEGMGTTQSPSKASVGVKEGRVVLRGPSGYCTCAGQLLNGSVCLVGHYKETETFSGVPRMASDSIQNPAITICHTDVNLLWRMRCFVLVKITNYDQVNHGNN